MSQESQIPRGQVAKFPRLGLSKLFEKDGQN